MILTKVGSIVKLQDAKKDGLAICVHLKINDAERNMLLTTPDCPSGVGGRAPNPAEREIIELWEKRGMNNQNFTGGNLIAFLKQPPFLNN
ncbi:MAG: hypothetical protein HY707_06135 [Ignavibacteriae bacterium]|nr:hypothetical protein [Ignavibacteriota bacterium]